MTDPSQLLATAELPNFDAVEPNTGSAQGVWPRDGICKAFVNGINWTPDNIRYDVYDPKGKQIPALVVVARYEVFSTGSDREKADYDPSDDGLVFNGAAMEVALAPMSTERDQDGWRARNGGGRLKQLLGVMLDVNPLEINGKNLGDYLKQAQELVETKRVPIELKIESRENKKGYINHTEYAQKSLS